VPKATLKRRIDGTNINAVGHKQLFGRTADLPEEVETDLVNHVLQLEKRLFGFTRKDLRRFSYEMAEINNLPDRFSHENKMAGNKWYYGSIAHHPEISLRQPEVTFVARARGFCEENGTDFCSVLDKIVHGNNLDAGRIFNMDETALSTVQKPQKVVTLKGKHQIGPMTSAERGRNATCKCFISTACLFHRCFKRLRFKFEFSTVAPPGTQFACTENGWITSDVFVQWLKHFVQTTKLSKETKVFLLLDGHTTHTKYLQAINLKRENGVILLSLPAHTTHRLQLLNVGFFKTPSVYFNHACHNFR
jgi:hypothetical protein